MYFKCMKNNSDSKFIIVQSFIVRLKKSLTSNQSYEFQDLGQQSES